MTRILSLLALSLTPATACPVCDSQTGQQVRAAVFGPHFLTDLLAVLSPFLAVSLMVVWWARK